MKQFPEAVPFPAGAKVAHIGLPKTGTSAIQMALHRARGPLAEQGVLNAASKPHDRVASKNAIGHDSPLLPDNSRRRWERVARTFRTSDARCTILSSEALSQAEPDRIAGLVEALGGEPQIVITVRPLALIVRSAWQQGVRRGARTSIEDLLPAFLSRERHEEAPLSDRRSLRRHIETWGSAVGEENLTFVVVNPRDERWLLSTFERLLGVREHTLEAPLERNPSMPYPEAEMLRQFNAAFAEAGGDKDLWLQTVKRYGNIAMLGAIREFEPHAIALPRWAASRCNEITTGWVDAVEKSSANVVGDLQDLFVKEDTFPEKQDTPDHVSTRSAGTLAYVLYEAGLATAHELARDLARDMAEEMAADLAHRMAQELAAGIVQRQLDSGHAPPEVSASLLASYPTRELIHAVRQRAVSKLRRT